MGAQVDVPTLNRIQAEMVRLRDAGELTLDRWQALMKEAGPASGNRGEALLSILRLKPGGWTVRTENGNAYIG